MDIDLAGIRERLDASTPGPWHRHGADVRAAGGEVISQGRDGSAQVRAQADRDAEFMAHARQDLAALLDLVQERLREQTHQPDTRADRNGAATSPAQPAKHRKTS